MDKNKQGIEMQSDEEIVNKANRIVKEKEDETKNEEREDKSAQAAYPGSLIWDYLECHK